MIKITIKGKDETKKILETLPKRMGFALIKAMREAAIHIQSLAKEKAPVWRGMLRVSIVQTVKTEDNKLVAEVGSGLPYASAVEFGRKIGWFPPLNDLKVWARRKLGDERLAYPVARAIKRRGYREQPYLEPAIKEAAPRIQLIFNSRINALFNEGGSA